MGRFCFKDIQKNKGITSLLIDKSIIRRERNGFDNDIGAINKYLERIDIEYAVLTNIEYINRNLKKTKKYQLLNEQIQNKLKELNISFDKYKSQVVFYKFNYFIDINKRLKKINVHIKYNDFIISGFCSYHNVITTKELNDCIQLMLNKFNNTYQLIENVYKINDLINNSSYKDWESYIEFSSNCVYLHIKFLWQTARDLNLDILYMLDYDRYQEYYNYPWRRGISEKDFSIKIPLLSSDMPYCEKQTITYNILTCDQNNQITFDSMKQVVASYMTKLQHHIELKIQQLYNGHQIRIIAKEKN